MAFAPWLYIPLCLDGDWATHVCVLSLPIWPEKCQIKTHFMMSVTRVLHLTTKVTCWCNKALLLGVGLCIHGLILLQEPISSAEAQLFKNLAGLLHTPSQKILPLAWSWRPTDGTAAMLRIIWRWGRLQSRSVIASNSVHDGAKYVAHHHRHHCIWGHFMLTGV